MSRNFPAIFTQCQEHKTKKLDSPGNISSGSGVLWVIAKGQRWYLVERLPARREMRTSRRRYNKNGREIEQICHSARQWANGSRADQKICGNQSIKMPNRFWMSIRSICVLETISETTQETI